MKRIFVFLLLMSTVAVFAFNRDTTLMTIGGKAITLGEFEYLYKKNKQVTGEDENSLADYVDLFVNFKLKVIDAENMGMDTASHFVNELAGYQQQLAAPYLKDRDLDERLIQEAYARMKEEVEASHILIALKGEKPSDTLAAYEKALEVRRKALQTPFNVVAKTHSDDPSAASNGGYLGYFTAFQMVLPFEEAAFNTPVGEISMPVRSHFGYHLIKVSGRRKAKGAVNVSHILIMSNEQMSEEQRALKKEKAFELYNQLQNGAYFAYLAEKNSDDHASSVKGGNIGFIKTGETVPAFENAAFTLENKGDISAPVLTRFGWHLIQLEDKKAVPDYASSKEDIKRRLAMDERGSRSQTAFLEQLKKEYNYTLFPNKIKDLEEKTRGIQEDDSVLLNAMNDTIMTYGDAAQRQQDLIAFVRSKEPNGTNFVSRFEEFEKKVLLDYEKSRLEHKYPDFKYLMNEYHDGLLLFEISNEKVWKKAAKDEAGVLKFYKKNKKNYRFKTNCFDGTVFYMKDSLVLDDYEALKPVLDLEAIKDSLNRHQNVLKTETKRFELGENEVVDRLVFEQEKEQADANYEVVFLDGKSYKAGEIKPFEMTRGAVIAAYQEYLEKKWVKSLRKKYKVKINKNVLTLLEE